MECYICKKDFTYNTFGIHIKKCVKINNINEPLDDVKFNQLCYHYERNFNAIFFKNEYLVQKKSINEISKNTNIVYSHVIFLLEYFNIKRRTLKEECNNENVRKKYIKTVQLKYGVDNVSQSKMVKQKKREKFLKNYGVDNIFKDKLFKQWILENNFAWNSLSKEENKERVLKQTESIKMFWESSDNERKNKIIANNKIKYQKYLSELSEEERIKINKKKSDWWHNLSDEQKNTIYSKRTYYSSSLETKIGQILSDLNISYTRQKFVNGTSYDFLLIHTKTLIEVQGDFWHANPKIYVSDDILKHPGGDKLAKDIWKIDENKNLNAKKYHYKIVYIWESEIIKKTDNELIVLLLDKIYENQVNKQD